MKNTHLILFIFLVFFTTNLKAQQGYSGNGVLDCDHSNTAPPSPSYLYTCNGINQYCQAFLIYKAQPGFDSLKTISHLFSSDSMELARINNVSGSGSFEFAINKEVIIPVNCSCLGEYYQANTSYVIDSNDTYYSLATDQFQGLSSCSALIGENLYDAANLNAGLDLLVPLRCACPTRNQTEDGVKYLLTYSVNENDSLPSISERFGINNEETLSGNGFSEPDPVIYPLTTLLIPLSREPLPNNTITFHPIEYSPPPLTEPPNYGIERSNTALRYGLGAGIASLLVVSVICLVLLWLQRKKNEKLKRKNKATLPEDILDAMAGIDRVVKVFDVEELKAATNDFSSHCRIQGSVYKGKVSGSTVAIKRMSRDVSNEVNILHKLNHVNLIRLRGIGTWEEEHCYLVYEYMENGSLRDWLDDSSRSGLWSWLRRVQIAMDVAEGLDYLHNFSDPPYVHKNMKTSNVLLNSKMRAKITNFSLARSSAQSGGVVTKNIDGTFGYMAPEYVERGIVTPKLDVYSFGVVISELITGKNAIFEYRGREVQLSQVIVSVVEGDNAQEELSDLMDPTLRTRNPIGLVMAVAKLCVDCLTRDLENRPSMGKVVSTLSKIQTDTHIWAAAYQ